MSHQETEFQGVTEMLYLQAWQVEAPRAALLIVHGLNDHSSRYQHIAQYLNTKNITVFGYDQIGHGKATGLRAYIHNFDDLVHDLESVIRAVKEEIGNLPLFVMGHSMGGAVVTKFVLTKPTDAIKGILLSSAALKTNDDMSPIMQKLSGFLSNIIPKAAVVPLEAKHISRDENEVQKYINDPLMPKVNIRVRTGSEIIKATKFIQENMHKITIPMLISHGTADKLTDPKGSQWLYDRAKSEDKTLQLHEGFYHETFNDLGKEKVLQNVADWLEKRI